MFGIHHIKFRLVHGSGYRGIEVYLDLTFLTLFSGDDDYSIGSTRTVDRSRSRVFQDLDGFDVVSVQFVHTCFRWYSVNDIKRVVVVQRTDATDTDGSGAARITIGCNVHTGNTALKGFHRIVLTLFLNLVYLNDGYGTGQIGFALSGIAGHNDFVHHLCIFF